MKTKHNSEEQCVFSFASYPVTLILNELVELQHLSQTDFKCPVGKSSGQWHLDNRTVSITLYNLTVLIQIHSQFIVGMTSPSSLVR